MQLTWTWGWKHEVERKAKTGREGKMERKLERADRCRSAGRGRLWWGVKNLSVWERRSKVNQGGRCGTYRKFWCAPQYTRAKQVMPQHDKITMHSGYALWGRAHWPTQTGVPLIAKRCGPPLDKTDGGAPCQSPAEGPNGNIHLAKLGAWPQWC